MTGRNDVRRERSWNEQNEDNYWSSNVRRDDRRDDRYEGRGSDERSRSGRDQYGRAEHDSWSRHHDYNDSFDRTWHGAHGADREQNQRREAMNRDRRDWESYNGMASTRRMEEDRSRWNERYEDDRRWQPSRGQDHYDRRSDYEHGRDIPRHGRDNRTAPQGEDHYRGDERFRGDERYRGDERARDDERFRGSEFRSYDRMRDDDRRTGDRRGEQPQGSSQRGNNLTWRDFDRWSEDRIQDARHSGLGYSRGDDYHDRFWSTGDRHRDAW